MASQITSDAAKGKTREDANPGGSGPMIAGLEQAEKKAKKGLPPVHLWNPEHCGKLDIRIARDGTWYYMNSPFTRKRLVRLFSTILRHDDDGKFYLVTPVEKVEITVDDAPFVAVSMTVGGAGKNQVIRFGTNVEDETEAGPEHPIRFEVDAETGEPAPYVHVRANLEALINRAIFYDLVELGTEHEVDGVQWFGVWSGGEFFPFMKADDVARGA